MIAAFCLDKTKNISVLERYVQMRIKFNNIMTYTNLTPKDPINSSSFPL